MTTASPPQPHRALDRWVGARERTLLAVVLVIAALLRIGAFLEANQGPVTQGHRWQETDMAFFDAWANRIADGDVLGREPNHPLHLRHREVTLLLHPTLASPLPPTAQTNDELSKATRALWFGWWGERVFHQEPLYPYGIALVYAYITAEPRIVFVLQHVLGVFGIALTWLLTRRLFGPGAAILAAALLTLSAPLLAYELVLLRLTAICVVGTAVALALESAPRRDRRRDWALVGLVIGVAVLLKSTFVLVIPLALAFLAVPALLDAARRRDRASVLAPVAARAGALLLAAGVALSPAVARNVAVGVPALSLSSVGGQTLVNGLHAEYDPTAGAFLPSTAYAEVLETTDGAALPTLVETLRTHDGMSSFLGFAGRKALAIVRDVETPNNVSLAYIAERTTAVRLLPNVFPLLLALGLVGCVIALSPAGSGRGKPRRRWPALALLAVVGVQASSPVLGAVLSRYRLPVLVALAPLAGLCLSWCVGAVGERRWVPLGSTLAAVLGLTLATQTPAPGGVPPVRLSDHIAASEVYWQPEIESARERGDWRRVEALLVGALAHPPQIVADIADGVDIAEGGERAAPAPAGSPQETAARLESDGLLLSSGYADLHRQHADALSLLGRAEEARQALERARRLERAARARGSN